MESPESGVEMITELKENEIFVFGSNLAGRHGATSGTRGTSTSGDGGTSTSGTRGTSTSGDGGTSTSGDGGTSTSGDGGTSTSGYGGTISILHWNGKRYNLKIASVKDEDGDGDLKPNVKYRLNENGDFVEVV
jgi:hypothetical protein